MDLLNTILLIVTSVLTIIIIPLIKYCFNLSTRIAVLEAQKITKEDLDRLYLKLDDIKDEIHNNFISQKTCDFRHKV